MVKPGRRQSTVLYLEPKRAAATVGYAVMTLIFLTVCGAALLYRTDRWPERWRPENLVIPETALLVGAGVTGVFAVLAFGLSIANGRRWHVARAVERLSNDPGLAGLAPELELPPPAAVAPTIPPMEVQVVKPRKLPKPAGRLRRVTAGSNVVGHRPVQIAYLRLFENQPRTRTFIEGAWREFGYVHFLRSAGSVTPAEYRAARRLHNLPGMFIGSREQLAGALARASPEPWPSGRQRFRTVGPATIRVRDPYGSYPIRAILCHGRFWKEAVDLLLERADLVALDLSGFRPGNLGTRYELQRVIDRVRIERITFLADQRSDLRFIAAQLREAWARMAAGSPNAGVGARLAVVVVTDYYAGQASQGQGGQAGQVRVRLVAKRKQTRRVVAMAQDRADAVSRG